MSPEQKKLNELFSEALAKASPEERERYLASACGQDSDLRRQMDSLLFAHGEVGDFLKHTTIASNGQPIGEGPGSVIGRYKLLQQIGEGGFGVVFMAEQQEPVRRMVALKIIKVGMDTREMVARFEAGRQALALMDHPNIARVLDGGATDSGRPFFVMELIKGIPITEFCEQHKLSIEARLQLFMKVCAGVQHAHQKGVIHRDLKPSNVLVMLHDGEPVPKVIDFGIAKALGQKLTERTLFTRFEQLIGTPAYMSPEQAEWGGQDIDTRSDLYSLGVLLYELLTGTTPLEKETLACAALDEMRRMIRETEPPKPSTRLTALLAADARRPMESGDRPSEVSAQPTDSASLRRRLQAVRGDLDWIVMKTVEKDRTRRYETVNGLLMDIQRFLSNETVLARPPSTAYRLGKVIRRNKLTFTVAGVLVTALTVGFGGMTWAFLSERAARSKVAAARMSIGEVVRRVVFNGMDSSPANKGTISFHGLEFELTRDERVQAILEEELQTACESLKAKAALGIIVQPESGDVVAMGNYPQLSPNDMNPCVSTSMEPCALMSFVVVAAALNEHLVSLDSFFDCEHGRIHRSGRLLHDDAEYGILSVSEIIIKGSRIGSLKIAEKLGNKRLYEYIRRFGFGERAGVHLAGESPGAVVPLESWSKLTPLYVSTGHSMMVTPLQLAMAMSTIANGGKLMVPRIVKTVRNENGVEIVRFSPEVVRVVTSIETTKLLKEALAGVTSLEGVAPKANVKGLLAAGATASDQKITNGVYVRKIDTCCFVGFVPFDHPEFVCLISIREPGLDSDTEQTATVSRAGDIAGPVFSRVANRVALYLGLKPSSSNGE